jgi:(heptosyl)LPS beta-1,4-glucosyltransferase
MSTVSAVIIVKNEEAHLAQCLSALQWVDELIVLDSGSTDATCRIAESFNARVVQAEDWQGFGIQRQRAQALARCNWVLMIDADERVTPELKASIQAHIQGEPAIGRMSRLSWCFGGFIRHSGWYPDLIDRLYPREAAHYNSDLVHEKLVYPNSLPVKRLHGDLLHFTYDSMRHYLVKSAHYAELWAQGRQRQGKTTRLSVAFLHGVSCFVRMYVLKAGFLDGRPGLLLAVLSAHSTFVKYADLWVRGTTQRQQVDQSDTSTKHPPRA